MFKFKKIPPLNQIKHYLPTKIIRAAQKIKNDLIKAKPTTQNVLNYRKSGDAYLCCVKIYPLFNKDRELVNYIAFENEIKPDAA